MNFYVCEHCNSVITHMKNSGLPVICCGQKMKFLAPERIGAAEKHFPEVTVENNKVTIDVSAVEHPMAREHYIEWIVLETSNGNQMIKLSPSDKPKAEFYVANDTKLIAAYAHCNLHGLWKNLL